MTTEMHRNIAWAGAGLGILLIVLQGTMAIPARMAEGGGFWRALVYYFSYFTIWTNTGLVLVYFAVAAGRKRLRFLTGPTARTLMAGSILIVMIIYAVLLAPVWNPQGLMLLTDIGLHYVAPVLYLVWWALGPHPVRLRYGRAAVMMVYPVAYCVWVIVRGLTIGRWPYPFVDVSTLGWGPVLLNMAGLSLVFAAVFLGAIGLSRRLHARARFGGLAR